MINEEIKDLIGEEVTPVGLPLRENAQGEVTVAGLTKHEVYTAVHVLYDIHANRVGQSKHDSAPNQNTGRL